LWFIAIGDVRVETSTRDLETEDSDTKTDEGDDVAFLADGAAEDYDPDGHEDCGEGGEVEAVFRLANVSVDI